MLVLSTLMLSAALAAEDPCAVPAGPDAHICHARVGHCFDVEIDGQRAEPLADAALRARLTEQAGSKAVCWTLPKPTMDDIDIVVRANEHTADLGELRPGYEVVVTGLEGQQVPTHKGIRTDPTVRIGGLPMQTAVDVIDGKALPPGAYIIRVRVVGKLGYEDKSIYVHVERPVAAAQR
jgi:hypothetical protein